MEQLLYETAPTAYPALTSEALGGSRSPCPAPGLSKAPANPQGGRAAPLPSPAAAAAAAAASGEQALPE